MSNIDEFVKLLRQRENIKKIGAVVGTIITVEPLVIDLGIGINIDSENMTLSTTFIASSKHKGDRVILMADETNNHFFIIDKVG